MESIPAELKAQPVSPVLITGCPELHTQLEQYFSKTLKPPIRVLRQTEETPDFEFFYQEDAPNDVTDEAEAQGMLKVSWMRHLRHSHPVVIAVFIHRSDVDTDPQSWADVLSKLQSVKECCSLHDSKFVVVVVSDELKDLPVEVISTLKFRFGLDERYILSLLAINVDPADPSVVQLANNELKSIGHSILENAWAVHQEHAQRINLESSQRLQAPGQAQVLDCCKVSPPDALLAEELGFLAEFQQDWTTAVSQYGLAYRHLLDLLRTQRLKNQLLLEALYVSEFITMKMCTLLMHQQRSEEAWKQFHLHLSKFRIPTGTLRMGLYGFFLGWLSRQYQIMLDVVNLRTGTHQSLLSVSIISRRHLANLYFYAAEAAVKQRRRISASLKQLSATKLPVYDFVVPSQYWGQFRLKSDDAFKDVPEDVLDDYLLAVESNKPLQETSIALLQSCLTHLKQSKVVRKAAHVSALLAEEQLAAGEVHAARENLLNVADTYRRDGWNHPLSAALKLLIEISSESFWEKAIYSLELATLEDVADIAERSALAQSGIESLLAERSGLLTEMSQSKLWESDEAESDLQGKRANVKGDFKDIGWSSVLEIRCGFQAVHELNTDIHFGVAVKSNLPVPLPILSVSVHFLEHKGQSRVIKLEDAQSIYLKTGQWREFLTSFPPVIHGEMRVEYIEIRFGPQSSLAWHLRLSNKPSMDEQTMEPDYIEHLPFKHSIISPGLHSIRIKHVGASPTLTVVGPRDLYLGEVIFVSVEVSCEAVFEGESLRLDLSCDNSMANPQWIDKASSILEVTEIHAAEGAPWKAEHQVSVHSFGVVSVRATLRLNSETVISQCLSFEVKEPFFVESRVLAPPVTYLFLPSSSDATSDPLATAPATGHKTATSSTSVCIAEGSEAFVQLAVKCKADCELILMNAEYLTKDDSRLEVAHWKVQDVLTRRGDVQSMLFKIKPIKSNSSPMTSSLSLQWKRDSQIPRRQISSSLMEESTATDLPGKGERCEAKTLCRLHDISVQRALLTAQCQLPGAVQTGIPFGYTLHLSNQTELPEEFAISVTEAAGCLFCGDRASQVLIAPQDRRRIQWECVTYASGNVKLPRIQIASPRLKCFVEMDGTEIFVQPPHLA